MVAEWIKKEQDQCTSSLQDTNLRSKEKHRLKVKKWKKIFHSNRNKKKNWDSNTNIKSN